jgi:NCS1 nucleoside transporter family
MSSVATEHRVPRGVERYGVEPIPPELRTVGWRDLFAMMLAFNLSPLMYVIGAIVVVEGGLPLWWAAGTVALGVTFAGLILVVVAQAGVDYGLPGQVAMRATFGQLAARALTSPYRAVAAVYWFAAQAIAGAFGLQAIVRGLTDHELPLVPVAVGFAAVQAVLAAVGFDLLRYFVRVLLPLMVVFTGALVALYLTADEPAYAVSRVFDSPDQAWSWVGFATFLTVLWGTQLTFVTNVADFCRYARSRRHMYAGLLSGTILGSFVAAWVGGYAAVATGSLNPFVAVADLGGNAVLLAVLLVAVVLQTTAVNLMNVYSGGLSLVNAIPRIGRFWWTVIVGAIAVGLSALPELIEDAADWMTHLGNVATPLAGVIIADYAILKRTHIDVLALFEPNGRYRFLRGVNPAALGAVAIGVAVYYVLPHEWVKAAWGVGVAIASYLALAWLQSALFPRTRPGLQPAEAEAEEAVAEAWPPEPDGFVPGPMPREVPAAVYVAALDGAPADRARRARTAATVAIGVGLVACVGLAWLRRRRREPTAI